MSPTSIVAYLTLFMAAGFLFVFASLLLGRFLRPKSPTAVKLQTYECGEPAVGSSYVQFDLRFYVVALLFIIFDVEMAFFFPWATVFGKATQLMDPNLPVVVVGPRGAVELSAAAQQKFHELGVPDPAVPRGSTAIGPDGDARHRGVFRRAVGGLCLRLVPRRLGLGPGGDAPAGRGA
jgi:NADH-quinone oxidoreductase subunit A